MATIDVTQIQTELERRIAQRSGDEVIRIAQNGQVIGAIRYIPEPSGHPMEPRPIGLAAGKVTVPPEFFEPLPDDLLAAFNGESE